MKLFDFGVEATREWLQQVLLWSRNKVSFVDNLDCQFLLANIGTTETEVGHSLGRAPRYVIEVASYPNGTAGIQFTKEPTHQKLFLTRTTAGQCTLLLI